MMSNLIEIVTAIGALVSIGSLTMAARHGMKIQNHQALPPQSEE